MFVGPPEAMKITFVVGYNQGYRRMKAYADLHAYLGVSYACSRDYSPSLNNPNTSTPHHGEVIFSFVGFVVSRVLFAF